MTDVIGRPEDVAVVGIQIFLRQARRNLTRQEWMQAMMWDRRVRRTLPWHGEERRTA